MNSLNESPANALPYLYGKWIGQLLKDSIPEEQGATCNSCAMCFRESRGPRRHAFYFNPAVKCCTYIPELPNFLLGAILAKEGGDMTFGYSSIKQRLSTGAGVTPLSLSPSPSFTLLYRNSPAAFGLSQTLSCPHYMTQTGRCGIWQYRAPPCITWFCKHNRGAIGRDFWRELYLLLMSIQQSVAVWCMAQLEIDTETMRMVLNQPQRIDAEFSIGGDMLDGRADESWRRSVWGNWYGRQEEFYRHCTRLAEDLDWQKVATLCGAEVQIRAQIVKAAHRKLIAKDVPTRLQTGSYQVVSTSENYVRVVTYSPYDPLDIPKQVIDVLPYFDGRPLAEALDIVTRQKSRPFNSKVLQTLLDFGVLIEDPEDS